MAANQVFVKNISASTSNKEIRDFFSFCGKISDLEVKTVGQTQEASVTFEKATAAKTALLLDATRLGSHEVKVESVSASSSDDEHHPDNTSDTLIQEDKPRARIIAEYLAHGYVVKDAGIQRAIDLDHKHGVSARFLSTLQRLDDKYKATEKAKSADQSYGISQKVNSLLSGLTSYYEKAADTPTGQKLVNFYTTSQKQVLDIHNEASRLAEIKKREAGGGTPHEVTESGKTQCNCGSDPEACKCASDTCACKDCGTKSDLYSVPGTNDTKCGCNNDISKCACQPGHCACDSCPKSNKWSNPAAAGKA